ncbi:MAG: twin-arginine translocation signal domain-containing protein, partial [Rhodothermales bacterium]|nr:twin-arginine translocation signal domain-containing protein [Rhodothermales bacterium]
MLDTLTSLSEAAPDDAVSRRSFLGRFAALGAAGFLAACGGGEEPAEGEAAGNGVAEAVAECDDVEGLPEQAI